MQQNFPFQPSGAQGATPSASVAIAITAAVQQITLPATSSDDNAMLIMVDDAPGTGARVAWSYGVSSGLAIGNGVPMMPGDTRVFALPPGVTQLSVIGSAATGTFRVCVGRGA